MSRRCIIGVALLSVASSALAGCIYIPGAERPLEIPSPRLDQLVGSGKPIRPGVVTRDQVIERMGQPTWRSAGNTSFLYTSWVNGGYWVMLPFIPIGPSTHIIAARLDFDADGVLRHTRIERGKPTPASLLTTRGPQAPPMVRDFRQQQSTTGPATTSPALE